jgi:hypothetical protein
MNINYVRPKIIEVALKWRHQFYQLIKLTFPSWCYLH